ncbi:PREDICTED: ribosome biogenesis protein BOP1 homolog [Trachymyrmex cornetzi]|uniref:ribosome biogenesis protein BOP1 homolog n=1 Tax=Trachymyrmex cornetzi TaxID=471704 RepID=UPI00084EFEE7|nr:PREDICTED: ribosome biogenesis protein BOP1 homolog [Trachymyrmex cornetzi]
MGQKKVSKRKYVNPKLKESKNETEKDVHVSHNAKNSDMEDLIAAQINVDEDATDDEVEKDIVISSSDEEVEQDEVIFDSDEEVEQDEGIFDSDENNDDSDEDSDDSDEDSNDSDEDNDGSEDIESESSYEEVQEDSPIKLKDDKLKNKSKSKKPLSFKDKTLTKETTSVINKLRNNKNHKNFDKAQMHKDEAHNEQKINTSTANDEDEYVYDSSDEEDIRNTIGNVPLKWYNEYDHVGYDWEGKKIPKPEKGDELDNFLKRMEDPNFWRTIKDPQTGQDVVMSEADIDLIVRIQKQKIPDVQFDEYAPWVDWFTSEVMKTPLRKFPEHKRSFLPSKNEARKVSKLVHALKMGWMKSTAEMQKEREKNKGPQFYMLWQSDDQAEEMRRIHKHIPAPKRHLPGHAESYNPPPEYLFDNKELKEWNKLKATPWKRKLHFIPQKFNSLREVPAFPKYVKERFQRCLDLYLCSRSLKMRLTIEPEVLVPQLPSPKDLQPFPTTMFMVFKGHTDMVRSITVEPEGQFIASGGDDMLLKIWEVNTGRCLKTVPCGGVIRSVVWRPNQAMSLIAVAADKKVLLINPGVGDNLITSKTDQLLEIIPQSEIIVSDRVQSAVQWEQVEGDHWNNGVRIILNHFKTVKQVTWHGKGDYFATVMPDGQNRSVLINQLSKRRSQLPFNKSKGLIQCVLFHPIKPYLFVATQRNVRVYDLVQQIMVKKLLSNSQWISSMDIHPGGDNVLVGTYDRKMLWFDLDFSKEPYQTLRLHGTGIRAVAFHKRYPLFASGADDRALIVSHGMVYNDLLQNPLIVPLKRLCNHESYNDFGILDVIFHPIEPWVFSAGADFTIRMYT